MTTPDQTGFWKNTNGAGNGLRLSPVAKRIRDLSASIWGEARAVELHGESEAMLCLLDRVQKFAQFKEPILIVGESGVGKEYIACACHLLSPRSNMPFEVVNCPQYREGNLTVSELFGHKKGSFTGAVRDHRGHFESADGGSIFLDEVADLHVDAQMMLLRALAEQEFKPIGGERTIRTNVRLISATNRPLRDMILSNEFRQDLYFRIRYFPLDVPALRDRGEDWKLLIGYYLQRLASEYGVEKRMSDDSLALLANYRWPGNIRELKAVATIGYSMAEGAVIRPADFEQELRRDEPKDAVQPIFSRIYNKIIHEGCPFWDAVYTPFMEREINRSQAVAVIRRGLIQTRGSYTALVPFFNMDPSDYQRFMDFLRHHRLKPEDHHHPDKRHERAAQQS